MKTLKIDVSSLPKNAFEIAVEIVERFIERGEIFSWDELQDYVIENGGILYVAPGMTLGQYMDYKEEKDIVYYNGKYRKWGVTKTLLKKIEEKQFEFSLN